jgi:hypothetical protein
VNRCAASEASACTSGSGPITLAGPCRRCRSAHTACRGVCANGITSRRRVSGAGAARRPAAKVEPRIRISWINQRFRAVRMRWCSRHSVQTQRGDICGRGRAGVRPDWLPPRRPPNSLTSPSQSWRRRTTDGDTLHTAAAWRNEGTTSGCFTRRTLASLTAIATRLGHMTAQ